jgi:hypothetical protein
VAGNPAQKLLDDIERGGTQADADIPTLLRKCIALGGQSGSVQLRDWATRELKGYREDQGDSIPEYRKVPATLVIDGATLMHRIQGQQISPVQLPTEARDKVEEQVQFWGPVAELSDMVKRATAEGEGAVGIGIVGGSALAGLMNAYAQQRGERHHIERVYHKVAVTSIVGVLDTVQTNLVELVAEIRSGLPDPQAAPDKQLGDHAVMVVIHGDRNRVELRNTAAATGGGTATVESSHPSPESKARRVMFWLIGIATVVAAVVAVLAWHPWIH